MATNMVYTTADMPLILPYLPFPTPPPLSPLYYYPTTIITPLNFSFPLLNTPFCCVENPSYPFSCPLLHIPPATIISTVYVGPSTITENNGYSQMNIPLYYFNYSFNPTIVSYPSFNSSYQFHYPLPYPTTESFPITETIKMIKEYPKRKHRKRLFKTLPFVHISPRMKRSSLLKKRHSNFSHHVYHRVKRSVLTWKPKSPSSTSSSPSATTATCFDFVESEDTNDGKTSIMIKNIPNSLRKKELLKYLDEHCYKENQEKVSKEQPTSEYDFIYLPMDFRSNFNFGYAFVNFTHATAAVKFHKSFQNKKWDEFGSKKICEITYARLQGKKELVNSFRRSYFECWTDDYLPTVFTPPRNGGADSINSKKFYIGRRKQRGF